MLPTCPTFAAKPRCAALVQATVVALVLVFDIFRGFEAELQPRKRRALRREASTGIPLLLAGSLADLFVLLPEVVFTCAPGRDQLVQISRLRPLLPVRPDFEVAREILAEFADADSFHFAYSLYTFSDCPLPSSSFLGG
jgi:hypothetical protein